MHMNMEYGEGDTNNTEREIKVMMLHKNVYALRLFPANLSHTTTDNSACVVLPHNSPLMQSTFL